MKIENCKLKILWMLFIFFLCIHTASASVTYRPGTSLGLVGCWEFDEGRGTTAGDCSGKGNKGTLTSSPTWVSGKHSKALNFNGSSNYVQVPYTPQLTPTNVSFGAWFKANNVTTNNQSIVSKTEAGGYNLYFNNTDGTCGSTTSMCGLVNVGGTYYPVDYATSNFSNNKWYHGFVTYDGETVKLYVNGALVNSNTNPSGNVSYSSSNTLCIGSEPSDTTCSASSPATNFFAGSIDDVRIYNRALSAAEVLALYKSGESVVNVIPPVRLNSGLVGYWSFDGSSITNGVIGDLSGQSNNANPVNIASSTFYVGGKIGQGVNFYNSGDYVKIPTVTTATTNMGFSAWVYWTGQVDAVNGQRILQIGDGSTQGWGVDISGSGACDAGSNIQLLISGNTCTGFSNPVTMPVNKWTHIVVQRGASAWQLYLNGVLQPSSSSLSPTAAVSGSSIGSSLWGKLDDVRVYDRVLNPAEINALYKMGQETINKTPVNRLTQGLVGYWTFDGKNAYGGTISDISGSGNNAGAVNIATSTFYSAGKIGQALTFDGVNDYVDAGAGSSLDFATGNFSASAWVKTRVKQRRTIINKFQYNGLGSVEQGFYMDMTATGIVRGGFETQPAGNYRITDSTTVVNDGKWHYVTLTRSAQNTANVYVDGVFQSSNTIIAGTVTTINTTNHLNIGQDGDQGGFNNYTDYWKGSIDDVRVYNRALSSSEVYQLYNMGR